MNEPSSQEPPTQPNPARQAPDHLLPERVASLEVSLKTLAAVQGDNTKYFRDVLYYVELQIHVQRRVMNDLVKGAVVCGEDGGVDYRHYEAHYAACASFAEFVRWLSELAQAREAEEDRVAREEHPEGAVMFGG